MSLIGLGAGAPVVLQLHSPKEKVWGILLAVDAAGIILRGLDLEIFDDWMRQEAHGDETMIAPSTIFYPMGRVVRLERHRVRLHLVRPVAAPEAAVICVDEPKLGGLSQRLCERRSAD